MIAGDRASLLVVTGEPSGDSVAAPVVAELGVPAFGLGGPDLRAAGTNLVADIRGLSALGVTAALSSAPVLLRALSRLARAVERNRPRAALLVGFSEVNAHIATWLRRRRVPVLWYAPPQVWAWRAGRAARIARSVDRLAVLLPFETDVWRRAGARVDYVGHPAIDRARAHSAGARNGGAVVAVLPGSRPSEVLTHLAPALDAADALRRDAQGRSLSARVVLARALPDRVAMWARRFAERRGAAVVSDPITPAISDAGVAIAASGTATLECAAAGVPPVIVYRTDRMTHAIASRCIRVPYIGLPNLVLGRAAFPELVQHAATAQRIRDAAADVLARPEQNLALCREVRARMSAGLGPETAAERVSRMLTPWFA